MGVPTRRSGAAGKVSWRVGVEALRPVDKGEEHNEDEHEVFDTDGKPRGKGIGEGDAE